MKMYLLFNCSTLVSLHFYLQMLLVIQYKESQWGFSASHEIQRKMMIHASITLSKIFWIFLLGFIYSFAKIASETLVPSWNEILS